MTNETTPTTEPGGGDRELPAREQLRQLLRQQAILYASSTQPITQRDGTPAPWAFYSWNVTLTSDGLRLAALNLLECLQRFHSTQLASFGYTATPLLAACVLQSGGRYTGLCIRETRKTYLSGRRVEGPGDRSKPVIIVDDSLSSGTSLYRAITALEEDGFQVEGAVVLVNFPYRGGLEWATAVGYHVEALFDIWHDLEMGQSHRAGDETAWPDFDATAAPIAGRLHPALVARRAAEYYLTTHKVPQPPDAMDADYDGRGGVFVSFRDRVTDERLARDGFWHFDPQAADPAYDVVRATVRTVDGAGGRIVLANLQQLKIAVTFFGPLEQIQPRALDFARFGIVVRSSAWPAKVGGALPNTQVFTSEIEQYTHARDRNARLGPQEPHELFRHGVRKCVEPGATWLAYGCADGPESAWSQAGAVGEALTNRAARLLQSMAMRAASAGEPLPEELIPEPVSAVGVTLYHHGFLSYGLAREGSLDERVEEAVRQAVQDRRFMDRGPEVELCNVSVAVSVLYSPEEHGEAAITKVAAKIRRGLDSLAVIQGDRVTTFLATALSYNNWSKEEFVRNLALAAGVEHGPCRWTTYKTATWVRSGVNVLQLRAGVPVLAVVAYDNVRCRHDIDLLGRFLLRNLTASGLPEYYQAPVSGEHIQTGTAARVLHGLMALDAGGGLLKQTAWCDAARKGLEYSLEHVRIVDGAGRLELPDQVNGTLAECVLLAAASANPQVAGHTAVHALARQVKNLFQLDGRIAAGPTNLTFAHDHDFLPGAALWALAAYVTGRDRGLSRGFLGAQLTWYRRRFRQLPTWGTVGWQCQGWGAVYRLTNDPEQASFVFELADWALERQLDKNGAFLEDLSPSEPSFNTGFIAEGIAAAWEVAVARGDTRRAEQYEGAWRRAAQFLTQLIVYPEDTFCMRDAERAIGGVRTTPSRSDIRVDQVSHGLHALVHGIAILEARGA